VVIKESVYWAIVLGLAIASVLGVLNPIIGT
jgi:predicted transcriptional regulator